MEPMIRKMLASAAVVGALGSFAAAGVYSAFSSTTQNDNNRVKAGSVTIADNDATASLYSFGTTGAGAKPNDFDEHCIKVTYSGSLPSTVKMYRTAVGALGTYVNLKITNGTGSAFDCSDFSGSTSLYDNTLSGFGATFGTGLALTNAAGNAAWSQNDAVTYKIRGTLMDDNNAQGGDTNTHTFTWEAQS
jgi:hypothetical protein